MARDPDVLELAEGQQIMMVDRVLKFNEYNWKQERIFVITQTSMLNIKQKKNLRRTIKLKDICGITINLSNPKELVIHINNEIDLRFLSKNRKRIIDTLKLWYLNQSKNKNVNLPIYGVKKASLIQFEKTLNDLKKGIQSKEPNDLTRLEEEDLVKVNLDDAICGLSDEEDDQPDLEISKSSGSFLDIKEESKQGIMNVQQNQSILS